MEDTDILLLDEPTKGMDAQVKRELAAIILDAAKKGCGDRKELRLICREHGMTADEEQSAFDPWGGLLRALCESGVLCHTAQQKKAFRPCPPFAPMTKADALRALMRRYLTHYGPVTVQDAAYFFGLPQRELLPVIESLSPQEFICEGKIFYSLCDINIIGDLSCCRFLAGFDPLMLGYEKRSNPFLPEEALRGVFTLAGIVRPSVLLDGKIVGVWKRRGKAAELTWLIPLQSLQRKRIEEEALRIFGDSVSKLVWRD